MKKIDFKKRSEEIEIAGKIYTIDVSNYDFIKKAQENLANLEEAQRKLNENRDVDSLLDCAKELIDFVLGDFDRIWDAAYHDIYNLMDLAIELSEVIQKGFEYKRSKYIDEREGK